MVQPEATIEEQSYAGAVSDAAHGMRLDHWLMEQRPDISRARIIGSIKQGAVLVNGTMVKAGYRLKSGDAVTGTLSDSSPSTTATPVAQPVAFHVVFADDALIVIDKPPDLVVHPGSGNRDQTLINGLLHRFTDLAEVGDAQRPGLVHRLDKDTSGLLVVARTKEAHRLLVQAFKDRQVRKTYLALVHGMPRQNQGEITAPIGRHPVQRQKMAIRQTSGRTAVTRWQVIKATARFSLLEVTIETGRTHQIRVHLAAIGHPVVGDRLYGGNRLQEGIPRQMLHAWELRFCHPLSGENLQFKAPPPADFQQAMRVLEGSLC